MRLSKLAEMDLNYVQFRSDCDCILSLQSIVKILSHFIFKKTKYIYNRNKNESRSNVIAFSLAFKNSGWKEYFKCYTRSVSNYYV